MYLIIIKFQLKLEETGFDSFLKSEISEFVGPMYEFSYFLAIRQGSLVRMSSSSLFTFKPCMQDLNSVYPMKTLSKCVGGNRLKHHMLRLEHCLYATKMVLRILRMKYAGVISRRLRPPPPRNFRVVGRTVDIYFTTVQFKY